MCRRVFFDDTILERESVFILCSFFLVSRILFKNLFLVRRTTKKNR